MSESIRPEDDAPFSPELEQDIFHDPVRSRPNRLQGIRGRDDLVVRMEPLPLRNIEMRKDLANSREAYQSNPDNSELQNTYHQNLDKYYDLQEIRNYQEYLKQLEAFEIHHSGYMPVIAANSLENRSRRYVVTNFIQGTSTEKDLEGVPSDVVLNTYKKIQNLLLSTYKNGGWYGWDLDMGQFVYDPVQNEMIFVDHEASHIDHIAAKDSEAAQKIRKHILRELKWVEDQTNTWHPELRSEIEQAFS